MDAEDKRGIVFGILGIITLIISIIGATLAYFTASSRSKDDAVTVKAANVKIVYEDGDKVNINNMIPSTKDIALELQRRYLEGETNNKCIDENGFEICDYYDFSITNNGEVDINVNISMVPTLLNSEEVGFKNLKFILFDRSTLEDGSTSNGTKLYESVVPEDYSKFSLAGTNVLLNKNGTKKYRLFIWLNEAGSDNDIEQGATFKSYISIEANTDGIITGKNSD